MRFVTTPSKVTDASVTVPGDKSISHRALMLGSIAQGRTDIGGFLAGEDCLATLAAMRLLGVQICHDEATNLSIEGVGADGLKEANSDVDLGNSGTAMRLLVGLLCGQPFTSVLTGDESLKQRPMGRVIKPLSYMGARIEASDNTPPLTLRGGNELTAIRYEMPIASAQVKSALLLAGMRAKGRTIVVEPAVTRDHTERMMRSMGAEIFSANGVISIDGGQTLVGTRVDVPADLSSAAFVMLAAILAEKADILIRNVGVNPTRTGVIDILQRMGADIAVENSRIMGQEPIADIRVKSSPLQGGVVDTSLVSLAIDEFPVLFVAAAAASGTTTFSGISELRVKESDRIATMAEGLQTLGVQVEESADGALVHGGRFVGGQVHSHGDHRVAMSLAIAGTVADGEVIVDDVAAVDTSFPGFSECLQSIGADIRLSE